MSAVFQIPPDEKYRLEREPLPQDFGAQLTTITGDIDDPVTKLRYLRGAIDGGREPQLEHVPAPARRLIHRLSGLAALRKLLHRDGPNVRPELVERVRQAQRKTHRVLALSVAGGALFVPVLLAGIVWTVQQPVEQAHVQAAVITDDSTNSDAVAAAELDDGVESLPPVAETLPAEELGVVPTTIWLADRGPGWELYSNGLRIETSYAVRGKPREYRVHRREGALGDVQTKPVGIIFHTSESDLWPLEEDFVRELRRSSSGLMRYVQREQAYNYVIDRFGRVYRIVDDETRANHAGRGVWARNDEVFLDLNSAFLGVSFETRWEGGRSLPITRAQLIAGRNLTNYLRQRFAIAPEMCVTHGLTSVNPRKMLIGYHLDWARGFPFAAFGLPDQYSTVLPSVALFGFSYDEDFLRVVGERWPGLVIADQQLANEAKERQTTIEVVRRERQARYAEWSKQTPAGESVAREAPNQSSKDKRG